MKKELQQIESGIDFYIINSCASQLLERKDDNLVTRLYCSYPFSYLLTFHASFGVFAVIKTDLYSSFFLLQFYYKDLKIKFFMIGDRYCE